MYCPNCGGPVQPEQKFCSRCGEATTPAPSAPLTAAPIPPSSTPYATAPAAAAQYSGIPQASRVAKHVQILGIIWVVVSFLRLIPAVIVLCLGHGGIPFLTMPMRGFLMPIMGALGAYLAVTAVIGLLVGWGLLDHRPWARMLAIIVGCLKLIDFPLGTALGIYSLWVLVAQGADEEYQRLARVS
jgi:hypothetical protein